MTKQRVTIIGAGRVGSSLAKLWSDAGEFTVHQVLCQTSQSAHAAVDFIGAGQVVEELGDLTRSDLFMIATPDDAILFIAEELSRLGILCPGNGVFHCSGALDSESLSAVLTQVSGVRTASLHPVRSFAEPVSVVSRFCGTFCALEGEQSLVQELTDALAGVGGRAFEITAADKNVYHVANVMLSNYLVSLIDSGLALYELIGIPVDDAFSIVSPLIESAIANVKAFGTVQALTGPIDRGDAKVVARHLECLRSRAPQYQKLYQSLAESTISLAARKRNLSREQLESLRQSLLPDSK